MLSHVIWEQLKYFESSGNKSETLITNFSWKEIKIQESDPLVFYSFKCRDVTTFSPVTQQSQQAQTKAACNPY